MFSNQHFALTFFTMCLLLTPAFFATKSLYFVVIAVAAGLGALAPDVDAPDAAIYHDKIRGTSRLAVGNRRLARVVNATFGRMLPVIFPVINWLAFKPYVLLLRIKGYSDAEKHRGAFHTIPASIVASTMITLVAGLILVALNSFNLLFLALVWLGFAIGFVFHLLEDACTVSGIDFFYPPFKWSIKLCGTVHTNQPPWFVDGFGVLLFLAILLEMLFLGANLVQLWAVEGAAILLVPFAWLIFTFLFCGVRPASRA